MSDSRSSITQSDDWTDVARQPTMFGMGTELRAMQDRTIAECAVEIEGSAACTCKIKKRGREEDCECACCYENVEGVSMAVLVRELHAAEHGALAMRWCTAACRRVEVILCETP